MKRLRNVLALTLLAAVLPGCYGGFVLVDHHHHGGNRLHHHGHHHHRGH